MTEHTPGTWVAKPHQFGGCWWVDTLDGSIQVSMKTLHKDEKDEANARFIAAAPDMEAVLDRLVYHWNEIDIEGRRELMMDARAALTKARGGSHGT